MLVCHGDDLFTILDNEKRDSYYYARTFTWVPRIVQKVNKGSTAGIVNVLYKDSTTFFLDGKDYRQVVFKEGGKWREGDRDK